jgi:Reverse transcriptase-like/Caulimovirus viroplasmin
MGKKTAYYAVARGRSGPKVYTTWEQTFSDINGFCNARHKRFNSEAEAKQFIASKTNSSRVFSAVPAAAAAPPAAVAAASKPSRTIAIDRPDSKLPARKPAAATKRSSATAAACINESAAAQADGFTATMWFDGGSRGNPGVSGAGAVLHNASGVQVWSGCKYLGSKHTNNEAEYTGLVIGLKAALEGGYKRLVINGDSTLVVKQMQGIWQCKAGNLMVRLRMLSLPYVCLVETISADIVFTAVRQCS